MRLFIIRHADPDYPNDSITTAGKAEAEALAVRLKRLGLDAIYTSPLGRAVATCGYTARALGLEPVCLDWAREITLPMVELADLGQTVMWDVHGHLMRTQERWQQINAGDWHSLEPFDAPLAREGVEAVAASSDAFLKQLGFERDGGIYRVLEPENRRKIAVFCHGGLGLTWLSHLLGISPPQMWGGFFLPPSSVTTILFDERVPGIATPRALGVGDISHLYAAGLPMQPAGIRANVD